MFKNIYLRFLFICFTLSFISFHSQFRPLCIPSNLTRFCLVIHFAFCIIIINVHINISSEMRCIVCLCLFVCFLLCWKRNLLLLLHLQFSSKLLWLYLKLKRKQIKPNDPSMYGEINWTSVFAMACIYYMLMKKLWLCVWDIVM